MITGGAFVAVGLLFSAGACADTPPGFHPDLDPDCAPQLQILARAQREVAVAASPFAARRELEAGWPAIPSTCRGGSWFLIAARALGREEGRALDTPDGLHLETTGAAIGAGLTAEPHHDKLLAYLAFLRTVSPAHVPELPADACRATDPERDDPIYVCAQVALSAGNAAEALRLFGRLHDPTPYPDAGLRWRQAAALAGQSAGPIPPSIDHPPSDSICAAFGATTAECGQVALAWTGLQP